MTRLLLEEPFDPAPGDKPKAIKPRDAATLILVRGGAEVMMGQRAKGHVFMPDKWVFPGGRVDPGDARATAARELAPETEALLRIGNVRRPPRAFAMAAVRETREEAGLVLGDGSGPDLSRLAFVCRAVTPPNRPRRFDARFFLARAEDVLPDDTPVKADDELLHTRWFSLDDAEKLDLPAITRFVMKEARVWLAGEARQPAYLRWRRGAHRMDRLSAS